MDARLEKFAIEIDSMVAFAKRINFDIETGDFNEFARLWYVDCFKAKRIMEDNMDNTIRILKQLVNK